jgi:hypothetical protein
MLSEAADDFHAGNRITITRLLTCPREIAICDNVPVPHVDLRKRDSLRKGTVIHADLERHTVDGYGEVEFPRPGKPAPLLLGAPISGRIDWVAADFGEIHDYKSHAETSRKMKTRILTAPENDSAQLNIARILIARDMLDVDPPTYRPKLIAWHTAQVKGGAVPWLPVEQPYMSEEDIGDYKPSGGEYSVREMLAMYQQFHRSIADGMEMRDAIKQIPLAGRKMFRKKKCQLYCVAQPFCDGLEGIGAEEDDGMFAFLEEM